MPTIRPLERADLPAVTSLYEHVARSGSREPARGLAEYFERSFFDHPWADPEIPSLVYLDDDGVVTGFMGSSVRRFTAGGRSLRVGVAGQLVTEPRVRTHAAGVFLTKRYLDGPQDFTVTDTASDVVRRIWDSLGGEPYHLACMGWVQVFRPLRFAGEFAARRSRRATATAARGLARPFDPVATRVLRGRFGPPSSETATEPLSAAALVEHLPSITRSLALVPAYDEEFVDWLVREVAAVESNGQLVARLVRDGEQPIGWFVYYGGKDAIASVLQVAAREEHVDTVLDALFADAHAGGAAGLQGRLEGSLREPLARMGCQFHQSGFLALLHSRDPALLHSIHAGHALLTRLEGEWWMGHHLPLARPAG